MSKILLCATSLLVAGLAGAGTAGAQDVDVYAAMRHPAVKAAMNVCRDDRDRLCGHVWPGGGRIVRCLAEKAEQLSPDCRTGMEQARDALVAAGIAKTGAAPPR